MTNTREYLQAKASKFGMDAMITHNGATNKWRIRCNDTKCVVEFAKWTDAVKFIEAFFE